MTENRKPKTVNRLLTPVVDTQVLKYSPVLIQPVREKMAQEAPLALFLQGEIYQHLLYLPGLEKELVLGFLLTSGIIEGVEDITELEFYPTGDQSSSCPSVKVALSDDLPQSTDYSSWLPLALLQGRSEAQQRLAATRMPTPSSPVKVQIQVDNLLALMARLPQRQKIFSQTGATHAICIADPIQGEIILSAEDVGRHNAFDKVIGQALLQKIPLYDKIALLSGRASYEMVLKATRAGIPLLSAVSAPTFLALKLAEFQGITLVGFARNDKMNIYTHAERLHGLGDNLSLLKRSDL